MPKKLNSAQRNYQKLKLKELKDLRTAELGKICGWTFVGIILLPTLIAPYLAYGYVKQALSRRKELDEEITSYT